MANPKVCEHLQPMLDHLIASGAKVTFAGQRGAVIAACGFILTARWISHRSKSSFRLRHASRCTRIAARTMAWRPAWSAMNTRMRSWGLMWNSAPESDESS